MSEYYVYIIYSDSKDVYYKGFTENPVKKFWEHNNNLSRYTSNNGPCTPLFLQKFNTKKEALKREKQLKRTNRNYIDWLIRQDYNLLKYKR